MSTICISSPTFFDAADPVFCGRRKVFLVRNIYDIFYAVVM